MKVSVVITAFNIEKYINECVKSVLNQTFKDIEIICVDDCSTDTTYSILKGLEQSDRRIRIIRNSINKGLSYSRRAGFRESTGKYIYIMDGDDLLENNALELLYNLAEKKDLDLVSFSGKVFFDTDKMCARYGEKKNIYKHDNYKDRVFSGAHLFEVLWNNEEKAGNMVFNFYKRAFIKSEYLIGVDGVKYGESPFALFISAKRAMCINNELYDRRFREGSDVTTPWTQIKVESLLIQYAFDLCFAEMNISNHKQSNWIKRYFLYRWNEILALYDECNLFRSEPILLEHSFLAQIIFKQYIKNNPRNTIFCELIDAEMLQVLGQEPEVIVYGAGRVARYVIDKLKKSNINNYTVVTSSGNSKGVKSREYLDDKPKDIPILLAVGRGTHKIIKEELSERGFFWLIDVTTM